MKEINSWKEYKKHYLKWLNRYHPKLEKKCFKLADLMFDLQTSGDDKWDKKLEKRVTEAFTEAVEEAVASVQKSKGIPDNCEKTFRKNFRRLLASGQ